MGGSIDATDSEPSAPGGHASGPLLSGNERFVEAVRVVGTQSVGALPIVGSLIVGVLEASWPSLWQRRAEHLLRELARRIGDVEAIQLQRDEVVTAAALAMRSAVVSDDEKITYLAAAVSNAVVAPDDWQHDIVVVLMRVVDELTASHFRVLDLLVDPSAWISRTGVVLEQLPRDGEYRLSYDLELALQRAAAPVRDLPLILGDLESRGLLNTLGSGNEAPSDRPQPIHPDTVSALGHRVYRFVTWKEADAPTSSA